MACMVCNVAVRTALSLSMDGSYVPPVKRCADNARRCKKIAVKNSSIDFHSSTAINAPLVVP